MIFYFFFYQYNAFSFCFRMCSPYKGTPIWGINIFPLIELMQFKSFWEIELSHISNPVYPLNQCEEEEAYESLEICFHPPEELDLLGLKVYSVSI